jgi:hypothetical protein
MKTIPQRDIIRRVGGEVTNNEVIPNGNKFSFSATTDKMGITTGGAIAKGFIWGLMIGAFVVLGIGMWKDKISISYSK